MNDKNVHLFHIFSKQGEYCLVYVAGVGETIEINLTGNTNYQVEIIDTWNMHIQKQTTAEPGIFEYKTVSPFTALRIYNGHKE